MYMCYKLYTSKRIIVVFSSRALKRPSVFELNLVPNSASLLTFLKLLRLRLRLRLRELNIPYDRRHLLH
jgi:hypothetical protein